MGLGPGESIEYTKHRVSLVGHPWPGCRPISDTWCPYSYGQTKQKRGLNNVGQVNMEDCCLSRKDSGLQGHPGCKTLQMWMGRTSRATSQMPEMDTPLDHAQEKVDASGGMGSDSGGALQPQ